MNCSFDFADSNNCAGLFSESELFIRLIAHFLVFQIYHFSNQRIIAVLKEHAEYIAGVACLDKLG